MLPSFFSNPALLTNHHMLLSFCSNPSICYLMNHHMLTAFYSNPSRHYLMNHSCPTRLCLMSHHMHPAFCSRLTINMQDTARCTTIYNATKLCIKRYRATIATAFSSRNSTTQSTKETQVNNSSHPLNKNLHEVPPQYPNLLIKLSTAFFNRPARCCLKSHHIIYMLLLTVTAQPNKKLYEEPQRARSTTLQKCSN